MPCIMQGTHTGHLFYISMLLSQIIPPLPFPAESKHSLYIMMSPSINEVQAHLRYISQRNTADK